MNDQKPSIDLFPSGDLDISTSEKTAHELPKADIQARVMDFFSKPATLESSSAQVPEVLGSESQKTEPLPDMAPKQIPPNVSDDRLLRAISEDPAYLALLRSVDQKRVRSSLAIRYMIILFLLCVAMAWIVSSRVIMFGFSNTPLLAQARDILFALLGGLFAYTVWIGSDVWFGLSWMRFLTRAIGIFLFAMVLVRLLFF